MAEDVQSQKTTASFDMFLLNNGFLTKVQYDKLKKIMSTQLGNQADSAGTNDIAHIVIREHLLESEDVVKAQAAYYSLPYIDLRTLKIPSEVLGTIPDESRNFYKAVPFALQGTSLKVALLDPTNIQTLEALEFLGQKQKVQINIYVASEESIEAVLGSKRNIETVVDEALGDIEELKAVDLQKLKTSQAQKKTIDPQVIEEAPIIKIVDVILSNAIDADASDIHIEPSETDIRVRYRIDGILHTSLRLPLTVLQAVISRVKILANLKIDEHRLPQDGRFHIEFDKKSVDMRVSVLPLMHGEKIVMRILDKTVSVPTLDQLGLRGKAQKWVEEEIMKTNGIFLITGPTGSGKSTTLYSILSIRNTPEVNIVTLEDPVEYFIEGVNQSQVNPEIGLTFASGLRSILRQDPNIVMVGEVRDEETAELTVHAALTGHLVFSTLHTNNAPGAIPRLEDLSIEEFLLMASINLLMAQRLVRKLCEHCKKKDTMTPAVKAEIEKELIGVPEGYLKGLKKDALELYKPVGCEKCDDSGYKGRIGIFEVMPMLPELQEAIFDHKSNLQKIYDIALKLGIISMKQDGIIKVIRGETTMQEIVRVTTE